MKSLHCVPLFEAPSNTSLRNLDNITASLLYNERFKLFFEGYVDISMESTMKDGLDNIDGEESDKNMGQTKRIKLENDHGSSSLNHEDETKDQLNSRNPLINVIKVEGKLDENVSKAPWMKRLDYSAELSIEEATFKCTLCSKSYTRKTSLNNHMEKKHFKEYYFYLRKQQLERINGRTTTNRRLIAKLPSNENTDSETCKDNRNVVERTENNSIVVKTTDSTICEEDKIAEYSDMEVAEEIQNPATPPDHGITVVRIDQPLIHIETSPNGVDSLGGDITIVKIDQPLIHAVVGVDEPLSENMNEQDDNAKSQMSDEDILVTTKQHFYPNVDKQLKGIQKQKDNVPLTMVRQLSNKSVNIHEESHCNLSEDEEPLTMIKQPFSTSVYKRKKKVSKLNEEVPISMVKESFFETIKDEDDSRINEQEELMSKEKVHAHGEFVLKCNPKGFIPLHGIEIGSKLEINRSLIKTDIPNDLSLKPTNQLLQNIIVTEEPLNHTEEHGTTFKDSLLDEGFKCVLCGKSYTRKTALNNHMEKKHTYRDGMIHYVCYEKVQPVKIEAKSVETQTTDHNTERPYGCSLCSKRFLTRSVLHVHERTHTGEKPFNCSNCSRNFVRKSQLEQHERTHSPVENKIEIDESQQSAYNRERPFECPYCHKRFLTSSVLKVHERTHTGEKPFECSYCSRRFARKSQLELHVRTHTGEKPFECSYCPKKFAQPNNLTDHLRIHTGERPFECTICKKRFVQKSSLRNHSMKMHGNEKMNEIKVNG